MSGEGGLDRWIWTGALGGTRTPNLLIRNQMLYPIGLRAQGAEFRGGPETVHRRLLGPRGIRMAERVGFEPTMSF